MNILYVYADTTDEWNCSEWRCMMPYKAIKQYDHPDFDAAVMSVQTFGKSAHAEISDIDLNIIKNTDVIILQRMGMGALFDTCLFWKAFGKIIILDLDDDYFHMPPDILSYDFWHNGIIYSGDKKIKMNNTPFEQLPWFGKAADLVSSPSLQIMKDWHENFGVKTVWLPNYLEFAPYSKAEIAEHNPDDFIIGWIGSNSHYHSFNSTIVNAVRKFILRHDDVKLSLIGNTHQIQKLFKLPPEKIVSKPKWYNFPTYIPMLKTFDIGIAPLYGLYDKSRSWIKVLEYMACDIPFIASDDVPYAPLKPYDGIYGAFAKTYGDWRDSLDFIYEHKDTLHINPDTGLTASQVVETDYNINTMIPSYLQELKENI